MTSRRSKKRSVSLRTSSFIRLISPFRQKSVYGEGDPKVEKFPGRVSGLHTAFSDTHLNISCKSNIPRSNVDNSINYSGQQRVNPGGNLISQQPTWTSHQELSQNNVRKDSAALRGVCISDLNLNSDNNLVDTSWLSQQNISAGSGNNLANFARAGSGLLGRTAVSYQNISPSGDIFADWDEERERGANRTGIDRAHSVLSRPTQGFNADTNKSTTNVAWLVGAARKADENHHIDIRDQDLQPPSHLAVAPIIATSSTSNSPLTVTSNSSDSLLAPSSLFAASSTPSPNQSYQEKVTPVKSNLNSIKMGYSLSRSKTVSDLPFWAHEYQVDKVTSDPPTPKKVTANMPVVRRNMSSDMSRNMSSDRNSMYAKGLAAATVSTMGSLKSKIVRHKTLLGSSSRLYKFSQSLSSLTTITSDSRPGSATSTFSRDPHPFHPIINTEKLDR